MCLIASPKAPFSNFADFVAFARAKNDNLIYASPGPGTQPHLGILSALSAIKAEGVHVPFTGAGPMTQAMLAGTVMAMSESTAVAKAGKLVVLAAQTKERIPALADVPTMQELGFPPRHSAPAAWWCRRRRPTAVVARLQKACADAVAGEGYKSTTERLNATARYLAGGRFQGHVRSQLRAQRRGGEEGRPREIAGHPSRRAQERERTVRIADDDDEVQRLGCGASHRKSAVADLRKLESDLG